MQALLNAIAVVLGKLMMFMYDTIAFHNYAIALILFTVFIRLVLFPLNAKQIKSTQKMQEIQPELQRLQERYKNDKEKLNEMTMKFYQEKGYNPASGCLPMLIQLPIMFALYYVIRMPMTYMLEIPQRTVGEMVISSVDAGELNKDSLRSKNYEQIKNDPYAVYQAFNTSDYYFEIKLIDSYKKHPEILDKVGTLSDAEIAKLTPEQKTKLAGNQLPILTDQQKAMLKRFDIRMLGIFNLGTMPSLDPGTIVKDPVKYIPPLILLILAVFSAYFTTKLMMPIPQKDKTGKTPNAGCANKSMLYFSPLMTLWIGTVAPGGLVFYWMVSSLLGYGQQKLMNKMYKKEKEEKQVVKIDSKGSKNS